MRTNRAQKAVAKTNHSSTISTTTVPRKDRNSRRNKDEGREKRPSSKSRSQRDSGRVSLIVEDSDEDIANVGTTAPQRRKRTRSGAYEAIVADSAPEQNDDESGPATGSTGVTVSSGDINAIAQLVTASERKMSKKFTSGYKLLTDQVQNANKSSRQVSEALQAVRLQVDMIETAGGARSQLIPSIVGKGKKQYTSTNRTKRIMPEEEVLNECPDLYNQLCFVFEAPLLPRGVAQTISEYIYTCHSAKDAIENTGRMWPVILSGLKKHWSRDEFKHGVGKQHAHSRFRIALNCLAAAKALSIDTLKAQYGEGVYKGSSSTSPSYASVQIGRRKEWDAFTWLEGHFLDKGTMKEARKQHELRKDVFSPKAVTAEEKKAFYVADHIVKVVLDLLRSSLDRFKVKLFETRSHLLFDWTSFQAFGEAHSLPKHT